jgi:hypothetical protein
MGPDNYSAIASAISAACALFTFLVFRTQTRGFVWAKDHKVNALINKDGTVHTQIEIPLFNLGNGNIRFVSLKAKKINLKTKAMENYSTDMHEAYFPPGVLILAYRTGILVAEGAMENQLVFVGGSLPQDPEELKQHQEKINKAIREAPEHIIVLKCQYFDGSWFGLRKKETVIGLSVTGVDTAYLSTGRRKELNEHFAW